MNGEFRGFLIFFFGFVFYFDDLGLESIDILKYWKIKYQTASFCSHE